MNPLFPLNIYTKKSVLKNGILLWAGGLALCIICFWFASGSFFTAEYYYPKSTGFFAIAIPVCIYKIFAQIGKINRNEPLIILTNEGLKYDQGIYKKIPVIKWDDIHNVDQIVNGRIKFIRVLIASPQKYIAQLSRSKDKENLDKQVRESSGLLPILIMPATIDYDPSELETIIHKNLERKI